VLDRRGKLPAGLVLNVNVPGIPAGEVTGVEVGTLGRRIYQDKLQLERDEDGRRHYILYGDDPKHHLDETDTDIAAVGRNAIAVTPLRFDVHDNESVDSITGWNLGDLLP
jgi:5'-nucleotidase